MSLGRKQRVKNSDWLKMIENIETLVSKKELDQKVKQTVKDIKATTKGKKVAFAWSGGKDSLVLEHICYMAGIEESVLVVCDLEYSAFMKWVEEHKPEHMEVVNTKQNMDWLAKHPSMLFPQKSSVASQWFQIVQHRG